MKTLTQFLTAVFVIAILAMIFSQSSLTASLISNASVALSKILGVIVGPVVSGNAGMTSVDTNQIRQ